MITTLLRFSPLVLLCAGLTTGCQQKMADQPAHRPYEESKLVASWNGSSARPLVNGVIHRGQPLSDDPLVTWLTAKGKAPEHTDAYKQWLTSRTVAAKDETGADIPPLSAADMEGLLAQKPQVGAPTDVGNFVSEMPFAPTADDLYRGQTLYNAVCAECHGAAGHGNGKIPERGFLRPPSYHPDPEGQAKDWSKYITQPDGSTAPDFTGNARGTSRGFYKYGQQVYLKDVPLGYIYQVIYWGYGGMGSHETQLPNPKDRWLVAAYVRALQLSQTADVTKLPANVKDRLTKKNDEPKKAEGNH